MLDANGNPITLKLSEGQAHDGRQGADMTGTICADQITLADRAYDSEALQTELSGRGAWANIKSMPHRVNVPSFSSWLYRYRNLVEHFFNKLKQLRAIATCFESTTPTTLARQTRSRPLMSAVYESVSLGLPAFTQPLIFDKWGNAERGATAH